MEPLAQRFGRLARIVGIGIVAAFVWSAPPAIAAPYVTVSPAPPTGWLSGGEYPVTATAVTDRELVSFKWGFGSSVSPDWAFCIRDGCPVTNPITYVVRPASLPDGTHILRATAWYWSDPVDRVRRIEDTSQSVEIRVDRSAPAAPSGLEVVGGNEWRSRNTFAVRWTLSQDAGSPFVAATYRVCPAEAFLMYSANCVTGVRRGPALSSISGISVPGSGHWQLQLALEDAMGHVDLDAGAIVDGLRLDTDAPDLRFLPPNPDDPARIQLIASDSHSGIASVAIEARRKGDASWRLLAVAARQGRLTALLDEDALPAGNYEVRAHATDVVGNERAIGFDDADPIQLPLRRGTRISAGATKRTGRKARTVLDRRPSVRFGARVPIQGRVTDEFGKGRANASVEVSERLELPGVAWRHVKTLMTDRNGAFTYSAPRGAARTIRFQYAGTPTTRAASTDVTLRVRAGSTLRPNRRSLRNGDTVVLRGRLLGQPWPSTGKLVTLQAWTSRGWVTFGNARARVKHGKWSYRYRFIGTTTTTRYRFRAVIPREESYPYTQGVSPVRAVVVRGAA